MRIIKSLLLVFGLVIAVIGIFGLMKKMVHPTGGSMSDVKSEQTMSLTSPVFESNGVIPIKYTCRGENLSPPLQISNVPEQAKSLVLIMYDPNAVSADWVHWLLWNIPSVINTIPENSLPPQATEGTTSFGEPGYGGPCPPAGTGTHHYHFRLYALDTVLGLESSGTRLQLEQAMKDHIISETDLIGIFSAQ